MVPVVPGPTRRSRWTGVDQFELLGGVQGGSAATGRAPRLHTFLRSKEKPPRRAVSGTPQGAPDRGRDALAVEDTIEGRGMKSVVSSLPLGDDRPRSVECGRTRGRCSRPRVGVSEQMFLVRLAGAGPPRHGAARASPAQLGWRVPGLGFVASDRRSDQGASGHRTPECRWTGSPRFAPDQRARQARLRDDARRGPCRPWRRLDGVLRRRAGGQAALHRRAPARRSPPLRTAPRSGASSADPRASARRPTHAHREGRSCRPRGGAAFRLRAAAGRRPHFHGHVLRGYFTPRPARAFQQIEQRSRASSDALFAVSPQVGTTSSS